LDEIWEAAPKFPDVDEAGTKYERIDIDSFIQIYRDIDDLFEDEEDEKDDMNNTNGIEGSAEPSGMEIADTAATKSDQKAKNVASTDIPTDATPAIDGEDIPEVEKEEHELELVFKTLLSDETGLVSRSTLRQWDEVKQLIHDEMLSEGEFNDLWERTPKSPGSSDQLIDVDGFLSFNVALDDLFVFGDDEEALNEEESDDLENDAVSTEKTSYTENESSQMVVGGDNPPAVIFSQLADNDFLVGMKDLKRWVELQEMLDEGELLPLELQGIFADVPKAPGTDDKINEDGFIALYDAIDELFEGDDEDIVGEDIGPSPTSIKPDLLKALSNLQEDYDGEERLPCGLESTEKEQSKILEMVAQLEKEPSNKLFSLGNNMKPTDLAGTWELLYTSSSMMKFNKGLSGLGGSFPNGKFAGLRQNLQAASYANDVEYTEHIAVTPEVSSFDVTITGDWELKSSVSILTGAPSVVMNVEPSKVVYGPTSTRADHWKSVRCMNLLDISYLDDDIRVMRGNTSTDTIFIFQRVTDET